MSSRRRPPATATDGDRTPSGRRSRSPREAARVPRGAPRRARPRSRSAARGFAALSASAARTSAGEGGRAGVEDDQLVVAGDGTTSVQVKSAGGASSSTAARHQRRRLGEPGRVPERPDLAPRLVARASAAIEALEGRRVQEERPSARGGLPASPARPRRRTDRRRPRQSDIRVGAESSGSTLAVPIASRERNPDRARRSTAFSAGGDAAGRGAGSCRRSRCCGRPG